MTNANIYLRIAAAGWDHEHWHKDFYPPDLPPDWRLSYYANEFREVLVPASAWLHDPMPDLRRWHEDTPDAFRFYLQMNASLLSRLNSNSVIQHLCSLNEKLGGVVMDRRSDARGPFTKALGGACPEAEVFEDADEFVGGDFRRWRSAAGHVAGCLINTHSTDLRKLRTDLERFVENMQAESAVIFIEGDIKTVQDATVIARLLGY